MPTTPNDPPTTREVTDATEQAAVVERMENAVRNLRVSMNTLLNALQHFNDAMQEAMKDWPQIKR